MYPEICKIGPFTIYSYGLMLVAAFIVSTILAGIQAKKENLSPDIIFNLAFTAFISGVIGARLFYILENLRFYLKDPLEMIMLQRGGLSWYGGLISGFFCGIAYLKKKNLPVYKTLDLISPYLALAQAIGRIGCFLNGCCYGKDNHPTQIYSSLLLISIFIILRFLQDRPHRAGQIFFTYLLLYSVKRFSIEFLRADNPVILFGLTLFQLISIGLFFFSLIKLRLILKSKE